MKRILKLGLTFVLLFSSIDFVSSNIKFYSGLPFDISKGLADRIVYAGLIFMLAWIVLMILNNQKENYDNRK